MSSETDFEKVVRIGTVETYSGGRRMSLYCNVKFHDGKLSISGVEGPTRSGDALGSCGQIEMSYAHSNPRHNDRRTSHPVTPEEINFAPGWDRRRWLGFLAIWHVWHLNDLKAECEHQRRMGWGTKTVHTDIWRRKAGISLRQSRVRRRWDARLSTGRLVQASERMLEFLALPFQRRTPALEKSPITSWRWVECYDFDHRHETTTRWLRPSEHPDGVLGKCCPVCGYSFGSAWLRAPVPDGVLAFLRNLPDADREPAWV